MSGAVASSGMLLKITDTAGTPALQTVLGLRTRHIQFNREMIDITNAESSGMWKEMLSAAGVKTAQISGDGVFVDDAGVEQARAAFFDGTTRQCEFFVPTFGTFSGKFLISQLSAAGTYNGEVTYSIQLDSAGVITYTTN